LATAIIYSIEYITLTSALSKKTKQHLILLVERVSTTSSTRSEEGIVNNRSTKRSRSGSSKGISSSTTKDKSTNYGSGGDTSDHTSSQTSNKSNREPTSSGLFNITTSVVGDVTARNGAVLGNWANNVEKEASTVRIADRLVAYISSVASNICVDTGIGQITSIRITSIIGAQVVVVTEFNVNRGEHTSHNGITSIISTSVHVITRRDRS